MILRYEGRSEEVVIIAADTFIGFHLAKAMAAVSHLVTAYGTQDAMPQPIAMTHHKTDYHHYDLLPDCNLVFFCHDVAETATCI